LFNFSPKSRPSIKRHPSKDKFITILSGSIRSTKTWTLSAKQLFRLNQYKVTDAGATGSCVPNANGYNCGFLNSRARAGNVGFVPKDDAINNAMAWQAQPGASLCQNTGWLMSYQQRWPQNTTPYQLDGAPNSNTFAHRSGTAASFNITTPPPNAPGW
jgi:hypothetical protein